MEKMKKKMEKMKKRKRTRKSKKKQDMRRKIRKKKTAEKEGKHVHISIALDATLCNKLITYFLLRIPRIQYDRHLPIHPLYEF